MSLITLGTKDIQGLYHGVGGWCGVWVAGGRTGEERMGG